MGKFKGIFGPGLAMLDPVIKSIMVRETWRGEARLYGIAHAQTGIHNVEELWRFSYGRFLLRYLFSASSRYLVIYNIW